MKYLVIVFAVLFIIGSVFGAGELVLTKGAFHPGEDGSWKMAQGNTATIISEWTIKNTTVRTMALDEIKITAAGSIDETQVELLLYKEVNVDGKISANDTFWEWKHFASDNSTATITVTGKTGAEIPAYGTITLLLAIIPIDETKIEGGDNVGLKLTEIKGHYPINSVQVANTYADSNSYSSFLTVIQKYVVDVASQNGTAHWIGGASNADSNGIYLGVESTTQDQTLIVSQCGNIIFKNEGYTAMPEIQSNQPIGQTFYSLSEGFINTGINLRASTSPGTDTIALVIRRNNSQGPIIVAETKQVNLEVPNHWYFFESGTCPQNQCGDNLVQAEEECETYDLKQKECSDFEGYYSGTLTCGAGCMYNKTQCLGLEATLKKVCIDGSYQNKSDFECSAMEYLGITQYVDGNISFDSQCNSNMSGCKTQEQIDAQNPPADNPPQAPVCGNNVLETNESCDSQQLNGKNCTSFGLDKGTLSCTNECVFNLSGCSYEITVQEQQEAVCGNGIRDGGERCDGTDLGPYTCIGLGYDSGTTKCDSQCNPDLSACQKIIQTENSGTAPIGNTGTGDSGVGINVCGNNVAEEGEECDGSDLKGATCTSKGWGSGMLKCSSSCRIDRSSCTPGTTTTTSGNQTGQGTEDGTGAGIQLATFDSSIIIYGIIALIIIGIIAFAGLSLMKKKPEAKIVPKKKK